MSISVGLRYNSNTMEPVFRAIPLCRLPGLATIEEALMPQQCRQAFSYERLENVGDSLLKFATCTALFSAHPSAHEGVLPTFVLVSCQTWLLACWVPG